MGKDCIACGGTMVDLGRMELQMGSYGLLFGALSNLLSGSLEVDLEGHREVLTAGDSVYYDSGHGHGMRAIDGAPCTFLAVILKKPTEDDGK